MRSEYWAIPLVLLALGCSPVEQPTLARVTVPRGASARQVADSLVARGVIESGWWFRIVARLRGADAQIKSGTYDLPQGASPVTLLGILTAGQEAQQRFSVPEGISLMELAAAAQQALGIDPDSLLAAATDSSLVERVAPGAPSVEGYLFPETYQLPVSIAAARLAEVMVGEFLHNWPERWDRRLDTLAMTRHQLVTLASIVEGEALVDQERPVISAVYHNRLRRGMRLQADPTVQYAIQQATGQRKSRLFTKDYQFDSPYNTYLVDGLPPGPISSPGLASLEAALYPDSVPYLYFVADNSGGHVFTSTYQEHLQAIRRIRGPGR